MVLHVEDEISVAPVSVQPGQQSEDGDGAVLTGELIQPPDLGSPAALSEHLQDTEWNSTVVYSFKKSLYFPQRLILPSAPKEKNSHDPYNG